MDDAGRDPGEHRGRRLAARYAVGDNPNIRRKLVVNEPTLDRPTDMQMSATNRSVVPEQGRRPLEPAGQQVDMGRLAECPAELGAEMGAGQAGLAGQVADVERLRVARVDEVLGAQ